MRTGRSCRASRVGELLEFDLALAASDELYTKNPARPSGAPFPFLGTSCSGRRLFGFDEAGRGALAGPIVVGCVAFPLSVLEDRKGVEAALGTVDDSKRLTPRGRQAAYEAIVTCARWAAGAASAAEIDVVGIVAAAERAARRAFQHMVVPCDLAVFDRGLSLGEPVPLDGGPAPGAGRPGSYRPSSAWGHLPTCVGFTRGDMRSLHVAAASIIAKVTRDRLMVGLGSRFPGYGFAEHKGYGTECHRAAILRLGPSAVHRATFLGRLDRTETQSC